MNWNKAPMRLWQTQLNFAVWCTSSACGVSSAHLNYTKHPMIRSVYRFHVYYHVRRILKKLQTPLLHETDFNTRASIQQTPQLIYRYRMGLGLGDGIWVRVLMKGGGSAPTLALAPVSYS